MLDFFWEKHWIWDALNGLYESYSRKYFDGTLQLLCGLSHTVWLAKEVEHLNKVLHYNNYPQWLNDKWGKSDKSGPLIHPETGYEIKIQIYISVPYFPELSEACKKIFKYMAI